MREVKKYDDMKETGDYIEYSYKVRYERRGDWLILYMPRLAPNMEAVIVKFGENPAFWELLGDMNNKVEVGWSDIPIRLIPFGAGLKWFEGSEAKALLEERINKKIAALEAKIV
jgi:hypothetical protein